MPVVKKKAPVKKKKKAAKKKPVAEKKATPKKAPDAEKARADLTPTAIMARLLAVLEDGPVEGGDIAQLVSDSFSLARTDPQSLLNYLGFARRRGWIRSFAPKDAVDKRVRAHELTPAGTEALHRAYEEAEDLLGV